MTQDHLAHRPPRLSSFDGSGHLEAGSRLMYIGMDHHDPYQALKRLVEDPHSMSVAIHEITHFHSLRNSIGRVLTLQGYLASITADGLRGQPTGGGAQANMYVDWFLFFRTRHELMLRTWAPLLEGLAVYAQTAKPCRELDELNPAVSTILSVAATLAALEESGASDLTSPAARINGLLNAAYRSTEFGPFLDVENRALAAAIEFPSSPQWLPYFLGHAYVRAVFDRLARRTDDFACPEKFIPLFLRLIRSSSYRIQRGKPTPEDPGYIGRIYGWIDTISAAPADRLRQALDSPTDFDLLLFLRTGERVPDNDLLSDRSPASPLEEALSAELSTIEPTAWRVLSHEAEDMSAFSVKQDPPGWTVHEAEGRMVRGIMLGVESLNFSSGGTARLAGMRLHAFGVNHAVGVRVADATWWVVLSDAELQDFPWTSCGIPGVPFTDEPFENWNLPDVGIPVTIDVYVSYVSMSGRQETRSEGLPECLIQLRDDEHRALFKLHPAPPPHHRGVLHPVNITSSTGALLASNPLRDMSSSAVSAGLEKWADYLLRHGEAVACNKVLSAHRQQRLAASRIDQLLARKILLELLGRPLQYGRQRAIMAEGMRGVLPETKGLLNLLTAAYSGPFFVNQYAGSSLKDDLADINRISQACIGKAVFDVDIDEHTVRYLGLWG